MSRKHSQMIEVRSDVKLHVEVTENHDDLDRPTLIFLHYWGGSTRTWSQVIPLVSSTYPSIAIDFRGWGTSSGPSDPAAYCIRHLASDVEVVIESMGLKNIVLVGLSMGAKVAQFVAGRRTLKGLKGLILVSPAPPTPLVLPPEASEQQIHAYETWQTAEFVMCNVLLASSRNLNAELLKQAIGDTLKGNKHARAAWPAYAMGEDIASLAKQIDVPVLVMAGADDVVEPLDRVKGEVCGNIHGSTLVIVPHSGHLIPLEAPNEVAKHIFGFLGGL